MDWLDKLRKIEALLKGAQTDGERQAAELAKTRIQNRHAFKEQEFSISLGNLWNKRLFMAICQKHGFRTYRYPRQKHTTAMIRVSKPILDEVLWPEFKKFSKLFEEFASEILEDLISKIHHVEEETVLSGELTGPASGFNS